MGHFVSGEEVDVDDIDEWSALQPARGACLEVNLPTSSLALADDDWGAFLVDRVDAKLDASLKRHFSRGVVSFGGLGAGGVLDDPPLLEPPLHIDRA